ncbi:MAG TPA: hypothetical protein VFC93_11730 [Chloroflexota bacterium]|nr:hypothetical protein [Chloroflexota bacterium]
MKGTIVETELAAALAARGIPAQPVGAALTRIRARDGRSIYVEERRHGAGTSWLVYADGLGREAPRQYACPTLALALHRIESELSLPPTLAEDVRGLGRGAAGGAASDSTPGQSTPSPRLSAGREEEATEP